MPETVTGDGHPLRARRAHGRSASVTPLHARPGAVGDLPPRAARRPAPDRLLRPRRQPDLARAGGGHRRARRRRVRGVRLRHGRDRRRAAAAARAARSCCPPTATTWPARSPGTSWPARRRVREVPTAGPVARRGLDGARAGAAGDPRPTPASTCATSPRSPPPRTPPARCSRSTTPPPPRSASARWSSAPTSPSPATPRPSPATATCCSATSAPPTRRWPPGCARLRTRGGAGPGPDGGLARPPRARPRSTCASPGRPPTPPRVVERGARAPGRRGVRWPGLPDDPAHDRRAAADAPVERRARG